MIRPTALPRPLKTGFAAAAVIGVVALAGCSTTDADAEDTTPATTEPTATESTAEASETGDAAEEVTVSDSVYTDGTYTADGSYATPESVETVSVTITLEDDIVTAVTVEGEPSNRESSDYQSQFIGSIADQVVGVNIDDLSVSRVAGSSLTSTGFNEAIETIKSEASA